MVRCPCHMLFEEDIYTNFGTGNSLQRVIGREVQVALALGR